MKKNFLFSMLAVLLAGFWFGGISLADCNNTDHQACIDEAGYTTLADAIAAISTEGDKTTVVLQKNVDLTETLTIGGGRNVELNLNGFNISKDDTPVLVQGGTLNVIGNGTIYESASDKHGAIVIVGSTNNTDTTYSNVTIGENVTLKGWAGIFIRQAGGPNNDGYSYGINVTLNGHIISPTNDGHAKGHGIYINGNIVDETNYPIINIGGNSTIVSKGQGIYAAGYTKLNIATGANIEGVDSAIEIRAGELTIDGGTFTSTAPTYSATANGDGTTVVGAALAIVQHTTLKPINVTIQGGTFDGAAKSVAVTNPQKNDIYADGHEVEITIAGGTFNGAIISENQKDGAPSVSNFIEGGNFDSELAPEYISTTADKDNITVNLASAVAKVGNIEFSTLENAIEAAQAGETVNIIKADTYPFPTSIPNNITIEGIREVILDASSAASTSSISSIPNGATFSGITVSFPNSAVNPPVEFGFYDAGNIVFNNCKIEGRFYTYGNTTYKNCELVGIGYPVTIYRGNVEFDGCTIESKGHTKGGYYLNAYNNGLAPSSDHSKVDAPYKITIKNTTFINSNDAHPEDKEKAALNIHEYYPNTPTILSYDVEISNVTLDGQFPDKWYGGTGVYMLGDIMSPNATGDPEINCDPEVNAVNYGTEAGGNIIVKVNGTTVYSTPKRDASGIIKHTVTFDGANETQVDDGSKVAKPTDPTKSCYTFIGWYNGNTAYDFNAVVTSDLALTSNWTYVCTSSSSGGGTKSNTTTKDEAKATTGDTAKLDETKTDETKADETNNDGDNNNEGNNNGATSENGFPKEFNDAYQFAYKNGITTMPSIEEAEMESPLTRIAMAKMLSQYAINILGKTPDTSKVVPAFPDVDEALDAEYNNGVTLAYQLGIMGIGIEEFRPFDLVTRAEFGTALSRMLYGLVDGEGEEWYLPHLQKLLDEQIITNDDPNLEELRGYVMIMLMRSSQKN